MSQKQCLLFAGQSVQESGMGKELLKIPQARDIITRLKPFLGQDLEYLLTEMPDSELALTYNAQRAIFSHHLAHYFAYKAAHPDWVLSGALGHSMGIVAALVAAGSLSIEDAGKFIAVRAKAFSDVCKTFKVPMGLAAASSDDFKDVVDEVAHFAPISVALYNTKSRGVLGGTLAELENFAQKAREEDWPLRIKVLRVEGPYHTKAFTPCRAELDRVLANIEIKPPQFPVFMGTSGQAETDPDRIRHLLSAQADSCELYLQAVQAAYAEGERHFIEIAHKPQPITWIPEQLISDDGALFEGVTMTAVKTEDIFA